MILHTDRRGRPEHVPFGGDVRGLYIEHTEIEISDINNMLNMEDRELKSRLYELMCSMKRHESYRSRIQTYENRNHPAEEEFIRKHYENPFNRGYSENELWKDAATYKRAESNRLFPKNFKLEPALKAKEIAPEPDTSGLVWSDE